MDVIGPGFGARAPGGEIAVPQRAQGFPQFFFFRVVFLVDGAAIYSW